MQHVDDGTIHAWLDRQVTDPEEVARIETHLRECPSCRARLADERATLEQADALLAAAAPVADAGRPAFETIVARAGSGGSGPADSRSGFRTWVMPVGWAASVALAAALGWAVRDRAPLSVEPQRDGRTTSQTAVPQPASSPVVQGQSQSGNTQAPASQPVSDPKPESRIPNPGRQESSQRKAASALDAPAAQTFTLNGTLAESAVPSPAKPAAEPPRPVDVPTQRDLPELSQAPAGGNSQSAPPPLPASPPATPAPTFRTGVDALDGAAPVTEARGAPPAPAAGAPGGGGGGGGGGGRGARAGGGGGGGRGGAGREGGPARAGDGANQGRIVVGGTAVAGGAAAAADASAWRPLPRTDAAAQSGMALYGIDGLTARATMLNADNSAVRTIYQLESGETIELVQQKVAAANTAADLARTGPAGATSTTTAAQAQLGQAQGQGQGQGQRPADPPPWTTVRDDVRLTLTGTANLSALGERLRLD